MQLSITIYETKYSKIILKLSKISNSLGCSINKKIYKFISLLSIIIKMINFFKALSLNYVITRYKSHTIKQCLI